MYNIVYIFILALLIFLSISKVSTPSYENSNDRNQQIAMRGVYTVLIIFCHMYKNRVGYQLDIASDILKIIAPTVVGIFFFYSGYGLSVQFNKNNNFSLTSKLTKSIIKLLIPAIIVYLVHVGITMIFNIINGIEIYSNIDSPINIGGWFVKSLLICYWLFYILAYFIKNKRVLFAANVGMALLGIIICKLGNVPSTYYIDVFTFILGIFAGFFSTAWKKLVSSRMLYVVSIVMSLVSGFIIVEINKGIIPSGVGVGTLVGFAASIFYVYAIQVTLTKICFQKESIFYWLGKRSYYIYICEPIALLISVNLTYKSISYYALYLILCVTVGSIFYFFDKKIFMKASDCVKIFSQK